ncbi:MinD/ParA family protein [candidate division KSB1 bacterium]|nr:MAG: MinD/ParA family protein [candidate division KSB1 bacterium]
MITKLQNGIINHASQTAPKTSEIIAVTSGKGGVGKTTISVNQAIDLRKLNKKVLVVDADLHLGNADLLLGIRATNTIADVVKKGLSLRETIISTRNKIDLLPASMASLDLIESEDAVLQKLAKAFKAFEHTYDYIIIDTGAGIAMNVLSFLLGADKISVVITPDPASITDAYAVIKVVKSVDKNIPIFLTANMVNHPEEGEVLYKKMNLMAHKFLNSHVLYGGAIVKDDIIARSVKQQRPFMIDHPNSSAANAIRAMNRRLLQTSGGNQLQQNNLFERVIKTKKTTVEWNH